MQSADIRPDHLRLVRDILQRYVPMAEVWAFGSRAKWLARDTSDLDLCIRDAAPLSFEQMGLLREAFEESNLPYKVDVVDWAAISASFRKVVERDKVVVKEAGRGGGMAGSGFRKCTLGDIAEFRNGKALSPDMYLPFGQRPVFGSNGQIARTNEILTKEPLVVIGRVGAYCGSVHHVDEPAWVTDNAIIATGKDQTDVRFLFYLLSSLDLRRTAIGSAQPLMTQGGLKVVPTTAPPLTEQKAIAHILGTLDDKIKLNRRMNATLEAMARALFQSWFVDFDPVRAKLDGRKPAGLDAATAAPFPEHFEHGEDGMLPVGWRSAAIEKLCVINAWALGKNDDLKVLEYVEISEVNRGNIANIATYARGEEPSRARRRLRHGDTVLSTVRPDRGSYFLALNPPENRVASTGFAVLSPTKAPWSFIHAAMTQSEVSDYLGQMADGGAYPAVRPEIIGSMKVALPNEPKILEAFHRTCAPLFEQAEANRTQSHTLATLRDTLLPKLLSGELSVDELNPDHVAMP